MSTRNFILFSGSLLAGGAIGFAIGYLVFKNKFRDLADKEIESVRKVYEKHFKQPEQKETEPMLEERKDGATLIITDKNTIKKNYNKLYSNEGVQKEEIPQNVIESTTPRKTTKEKSYVITPDEFQESDYTAETLFWFSDKVLTDSDYNVIHDIVGLIGPEALNTFGRYSDDTVYVRNDSDKIDYEIIWDARKYSAIKPKLGDSTLPSDDD